MFAKEALISVEATQRQNVFSIKPSINFQERCKHDGDKNDSYTDMRRIGAKMDMMLVKTKICELTGVDHVHVLGILRQWQHVTAYS
jgi:hypothetical protein